MFNRFNVQPFAPLRVLSETDSNKAYADREMAAFDNLSPELRQRISNSAFGASLADLVGDVRRRQPSRRAIQAVVSSGRLPCDVTDEEFLAVEIELLEAEERQRVGVA
jgi:hypothetical protein